MKVPSEFLPDRTARSRLLLFGLCAMLALVVGFVALDPKQAGKVIANGGYYYMLGLFSLFVVFVVRTVRAPGGIGSAGWRGQRWPVLAIAAATLFTLTSDPFQHKVLFDEYVLQATAYHMHVTKEIGTIIRAYEIDGTWVPIDPFLDKRPYFFTFLLSLVHDLTGYRTVNVFFLNSALTGLLLSLAYSFGRALTNRAGGVLVVVLLATMPLFGQNATSGGLEIHNLTMLLLVMCLAVHYLRAPDGDRLSVLCLGTVLLAESRYESVIYVFPVAGVIVIGWWKLRRVLLPWVAIVTPLLLIPYVWHNRFVSSVPLLWQLGAGQTERFSTQYLGPNLRGAVTFFFNFTTAFANSWYLSVLGCAGMLYFLVCAVRWVRRRTALAPEQTVIIWFGAAIVGNFVMLLFYYWSQLTDSIAARFALPACLLLALLAAVGVVRLNVRWPHALRAAFLGALAYLLVSALPAMSNRLYTVENQVMKEINWEHDVVMSRTKEPHLFISNTSTIPWMLWKTPSLIITVARKRGDQLRYHMAQGTFHEILVAQTLRPTTVDGKFGIDPEDLLPENFRLEFVAQKRFGGRMTRLSRLVAVDPEPAVSAGRAVEKMPAPPPAAKPLS